jgi:predicted ester cyclase
VVDTIVGGDKIAARCNVTGVHQGNLYGLSATNNSVEFDGMVILHLRDGKIVEAWNEFNFMDMYKQLGQKTLSLE